MALTPGTRLGPYEVTAAIGEGGMGQVFRARDTKLNRDVALKVLLDSFASDPERLARFTREAQTLASLNHPNIAHIHGLEESGGVRALVMELVEGDDHDAHEVRRRCHRALPVTDIRLGPALRIRGQRPTQLCGLTDEPPTTPRLSCGLVTVGNIELSSADERTAE